MKRGIAVLLSVGALVTVAYFTVSKWAIRHQTITFLDPSRDNRPVEVDIAVRRDREMQAEAGMIKLPVAILNHGNTVKFTEYSFISNIFAARGYLTVSIQHDLPTDAPMVTKVGVPLHEAVGMATDTPAFVIGLTGKGQFKIGGDADLVVMSPELEVTRTFLAGAEIFKR